MDLYSRKIVGWSMHHTGSTGINDGGITHGHQAEKALLGFTTILKTEVANMPVTATNHYWAKEVFYVR